MGFGDALFEELSSILQKYRGRGLAVISKLALKGDVTSIEETLALVQKLETISNGVRDECTALSGMYESLPITVRPLFDQQGEALPSESQVVLPYPSTATFSDYEKERHVRSAAINKLLDAGAPFDSKSLIQLLAEQGIQATVRQVSSVLGQRTQKKNRQGEAGGADGDGVASLTDTTTARPQKRTSGLTKEQKEYLRPFITQWVSIEGVTDTEELERRIREVSGFESVPLHRIALQGYITHYSQRDTFRPGH